MDSKKKILHELPTEEEILFSEFKEHKKEKYETSLKENISKAQEIRIKFATNYVALCESVGEPPTSTELENLKKCYIGLKLIHEKPNGNYTIYEELIKNLKPTLQRIAKLFNIKPVDIFQQVRKVFTEQFNMAVAFRICDYLVTSVPPFALAEGYQEFSAVDSHVLPPLILKNIHRTETLEKYESFIRQVHKVKLPITLKDVYDTSNMAKNWRHIHLENNNAELNMLSIVLLNIYLLGFYKT